jgi:hypothetical protein
VNYRLPDQDRYTPKQVITETDTYYAIETYKDKQVIMERETCYATETYKDKRVMPETETYYAIETYKDKRVITETETYTRLRHTRANESCRRQKLTMQLRQKRTWNQTE